MAILKHILILLIALYLAEGKSTLSSVKASKSSKGFPITVNCNNGATKASKAILDIVNMIRQMKIRLTNIEKKLKRGNGEKPPKNCKGTPKNCIDVKKKCEGGGKSGVYQIDPEGKGKFKVYCDQITDGGGWAVFQRRQDGSVDFYRGWTDYKNGFGELTGEFWLGLDNIHRLTQACDNKLRVDLQDTKGIRKYAKYSSFTIASERAKYAIALGTYSGNAGDSLSSEHGEQPFSTKDRDNDKYKGNCAVNYKGAWWYKSCHHSSLNGLYHHGKHSSSADGVNWYHWKGWNYSLKKSEMKIKPVPK